MKDLTKLTDRIFYVGVNDRTKHLFEGLWPLPLGVSYNAYLVCGERTALVDTVDACFTGRLLANVRERLGDRPLDYLVINHMEPDHSASIAAVRQAYPAVRIVGNAKTLQMIEGYYGIACGTVEVKEGDVLDLGGLTLAFCMIPMVHWPETMATWCAEERTIFSGDAFGTFGALNGDVTDEQLDVEPFWEEMRRYYACIVGKYGAPVQKALQKLSGLPIETICSTHGPVWQQEIGRVIGIYDQLSRYEGEPGVVIAYGSMYGNTAQMAEKIARELTVQGVKNIIVYNLSYADISNVIRDIFKYDTLIVGSPTYNGELFPEVGSLLQKISERCIPCRKFAYFGSYTWAGAAVRLLGEFAQKMKWEAICQPTEMKQGYDDQGAQCCTALAKAIAEKIR